VSEPLVSLHEVSVRAGAIPILLDAGLEVGAGEALGVAGPNGAGKTTLLGVIATLIPPDAGTGSILGAPLGTPAVRSVRPRIGLSGHEPALVPELTLLENLELMADVAGLSRDLATSALEQVGLHGARTRRSDRSSNGMRRRADLARLLMTRPEVLLLDEAHAGLDEEAEAIVAALVDDVRSRHGCAILVSHDGGRLRRTVDRVVRIEAGVLA
jgi:heme exporter protein A